MKKLAIFVEGYTEQCFVERLLRKRAGRKRLAVKPSSIGAWESSPRHRMLEAGESGKATTHFVLLFDCGADNKVGSAIKESYCGLVKGNYCGIIGIRDVYPDVGLNEVQQLRQGLGTHLRSKPIKVVFVLAVMEVEAWIIAEYTHLTKVHKRLTPAYVNSRLGLDPQNGDMQLRPNPAKDLDDIYGLVGLRYRKGRSAAERIMNLLDFEHLYRRVSARFPDLGVLVKQIDGFLQ